MPLSDHFTDALPRPLSTAEKRAAEILRCFLFEMRWEDSYLKCGQTEFGRKITANRMVYEEALPWEDSAAGEKTK